MYWNAARGRYEAKYVAGRKPHPTRVDAKLSAQIAMVNYRANQFCCKAADQAIQTHGGIGYTRHKPFEHIYRHHRRYRITEGSDEVQIRKVAQQLIGRITG